MLRNTSELGVGRGGETAGSHIKERKVRKCFNFERRDESDLEYNACILPVRSNIKQYITVANTKTQTKQKANKNCSKNESF